MRKKLTHCYPLAYTVVDSPLGKLALVSSSRGLTAISYTPSSTINELRNLGLVGTGRSGDGGDNGAAQRILEDTRSQLEQYFVGDRQSFALPLDLLPLLPCTVSTDGGEGDSGSQRIYPNPWVSQNGSFRSTTQAALLAVPYGQTWSYGDLAAYLGNPGASRAVGTSCATNPIPIVLPCHRITRADGSMGNYTGGVHIKRTLLKLEGALA